MATLRASPYSLTFGDIVVAKASARNANGWSAASIPNTSGT